MEIRKGYRQTDVGIIPNDWDILEFGQLVDYIKGFAFKSRDYSTDGTRVIRVSDTTFDSIKEENQIYIDEGPGDQYRKWRVEEDDLILSTVGSKPPMYDSMVGKVIIIPKKHAGSLLNQNAVLIRSKRKSKYEQQILLSHFRTKRYLRHIESIYRGNANQASITLVELFQFHIPLPKLDSEQAAIAEALSDADALISRLEQLIGKKRNIKQGAMQELLTGKKRLPGFSGEWEVKSLGEIFSFSGGFTASREQLSTDGFCYLHYGDIHKSDRTYIDVDKEYSEIPKLDIPIKSVSTKSLLNDGDVVFVDASEDDEGASKHIVVRNPEGITYISGLHTIVSKSKDDSLENRYKQYCFQTSNIKRQFKFYAVGTKVSGISKTNIAKIQMPLSTKAEQAAIAKILSDMDAEIEQLGQKLDKYRMIKQGMMQELLTGKTRLV